MNVNRRNFLLFLGATAGSLTSGFWNKKSEASVAIAQSASSLAVNDFSLSFRPVKVALPLEIEQLPVAQQLETYANYQVQDDLVLPEGFTYDLIAAWGDRVGDSRLFCSAIRSY